ncbi:hypothetical protein OG963_01155 [Streptomyces sp. NBC_01707]|uniref:hypothetical protein n=1 Tax=unclassified Streptomyces TaxID=2593676 RepID=UPI0029A1399B|nr:MULTISPECIES: hypothetical protein [unclassified Streptomyces]MDX3771795.1 hypothetical protein [Streptomyces sp. AK08-01B]MDX3821347.1 hypothetical protein [Streptomyces sp. AK08-01A]
MARNEPPAFVTLEAKTNSPLLPLHILTERNRAGSYLSVGQAVISMFGMFLFLSYYLQLVKGYAPSETGVAFLPWQLPRSSAPCSSPRG